MSNWVYDSMFYHIYPFGFCDAPKFNDGGKIENRIGKVIEWIPHLKELSVNAIYFGPVFESDEHGYDTRNYFKIDRRLGENEEFKRVCKKMHDNGIKIVLDGVFNHVGREFWAFEDVKKNGQNSKYCSWFSNLNFNSRSPMGDNFNYEPWNGHYNLVKLNVRNPEVEKHLLSAVEYWIDEFDIDGIRLDAVDCVDMEFLKKLNSFCKAKKGDFWLMGEIIHGDYNRWANEEMLQSVTNYECYKGIYSSHNEKNYFEIAHSFNREFGEGGIYKDLYLYNFVDNHDVNRIASTVHDKRHLDNIYTILFTMKGVPSIYYGSEWGVEGIKTRGSDENLRKSYELKDMKNYNTDLCDYIAKLSKIRSESDAIKRGSFQNILIKNEQLVYKREYKDEVVYVVLNLSNKDERIRFNTKERGSFLEVINNDQVESNGQIETLIPFFESKIFVLKKK